MDREEDSARLARPTESGLVEAETDALLGKLSRDIAHHVKNRVALIRLATMDLLNDPHLTSSQRKSLEKILHNAEATIKLVDALFKPYRQAKPRWVNANRLVEEAINFIGSHDATEIRVALAPDLPQVFVETQGAVDVFQELIINALKALRRCKKRGQIDIVSRLSSDKFVEILFSNTGPPIPRERWEAIFEMFTATDDSTGSREGLGLGLWATRVFLRRQGGDIRVLESDELRTTFVVRLPTTSGTE